MKKIQTLFALFVLGIASVVLLTQPVQALECSVLPQSMCNASETGELERSGIWMLLILVINVLTVGVGVVAVGAIAFAGFLYATAQDDQNKIKQSKEIIRNTVVGLIIYAFMFAGANFLIPGGIFTSSGTGGGGGGGGGGGAPICRPGSVDCAQ